MAFDRTTLIHGPAIITYDSQVMYTAGDIKVTPKLMTVDQKMSAFGRVGYRLDDIAVEITFTPIGKWAYYAKLLPHTTPVPGTSLAGATDKNVTIQTIAGVLETWNTGFVSKMPSATFSATKPIWGAVTMTCIGKNNTAWTDAAKRSVIASNAFADTSFAIADEVRQAYTIAWGSSAPWTTINTVDGITIEGSMSPKAVQLDSEGTMDYRMGEEGVEWVAKCTPAGVTETQLNDLLKTQGTGVSRGALMSGNAQILNISGTGVYVRMYLAFPRIGNLSHNAGANRIGDLEFVAHPGVATGAQSALIYFGTAAPA